MKSDILYIQQVCDAIKKIGTYAEGMSYEQFRADDKTQSAVIMQLIIIGELTKKISDTTKNIINLPWKDIAGFRDVAVHEYFYLDLDIVWDTIGGRLPDMREKLCSNKSSTSI